MWSPLERCSRQVWWPGEVKGWTQGSGFGDEPVTVGLGATLFRLDTEKFVGVAMAG